MSERRRDIQFEIQYLLSLTLVVFGMLSIDPVKEGMNEWAAYLVIFFLAAHLSIFNLVYSFGHATTLRVDMIETIERWSAPTLLFIGGSFVFLILHASSGIIFAYLTRHPGSPFTEWEIVIKYICPIVLVGTMGYSVKRRGIDPLSAFEGVNIKIVPEAVRVFPTAGASQALLVKVENNGGDTFPYELHIDIPDIVTLHKNGETVTGDYGEDTEVAPGHADRYSFELSHIADEHSAEALEVTIDADGVSYTSQVELELAV
ncbi:hypothetical protein [Haloarcula amylovorans]|uniref:hypothetical protein n=1 Tax=Haloarcula amylovorans TaxID=2562280 RepID=UPI001075E195|nr:hypothetical protein [Halomicroarcula amylolytica]